MSGREKKIYWLLVVSALLCILPSSVFAQNPTSMEYPYLYKSTRAMGMGGAYTAIGGRNDALFYNPAGLINIPRDKGWEVSLVNFSVELGDNVQNFVKDLQDATSSDVITDTNGNGNTDDEQLRAVNDVLAQYRGSNMHGRVSDFSSIGKSFDRWAFAVGAVGNGRLDAMTHQGFGPEGFLEMNFDVTAGGVGGFSYRWTDKLSLGVGAKSLHRESIVHNFSAREMVEQTDLGDYITKDVKKSGDATGIDAGFLYKLAPDSRTKPAIGVSVLNVGGLDFKDGSAKIPQTVNVGFALNPPFIIGRSLTLGFDYIDVTKAYTQDKDINKRLRYGAELQLFDIVPAELTLRAGMYEGSMTAGLDVRLLFFTIQYAMYTEEVGAYAGQDKDKRQLVTLNVGW